MAAPFPPLIPGSPLHVSSLVNRANSEAHGTRPSIHHSLSMNCDHRTPSAPYCRSLLVLSALFPPNLLCKMTLQNVGCSGALSCASVSVMSSSRWRLPVRSALRQPNHIPHPRRSPTPAHPCRRWMSAHNPLNRPMVRATTSKQENTRRPRTHRQTVHISRRRIARHRKLRRHPVANWFPGPQPTSAAVPRKQIIRARFVHPPARVRFRAARR